MDVIGSGFLDSNLDGMEPFESFRIQLILKL